MKKIFFLFILCFVVSLAALIYGCKKDTSPNPTTNIGTTISFTEEFENVYKLEETKGWVIKDNSNSSSSGPFASWIQGYRGYDKAGVWAGFSAYSYTASPDEFAYVSVTGAASNSSISSWLITPVLSVKNGDKISFYTRADSAGNFTDRMQVLINKSSSALVGGTTSSVGGFSNLLFDINSTQAVKGYPLIWTKYEYTFSGISGKTDTRVAFRCFGSNTTYAKGIGIDLFKFQTN